MYALLTTLRESCQQHGTFSLIVSVLAVNGEQRKVKRSVRTERRRMYHPMSRVADITQNTMQSQHRFFQSFAESLTGSAAIVGGLFTIHI